MAHKKSSRKGSKNTSLIKKITKILQKRSQKSLDLAKEIVLSEKIESKEINKAFEYYVKNWYDYIHPGLISIACEAVNGNPDDSVQMQSVMLLFTAAFDIHDDIIDESKTKYGTPTLLAKFGKDIALLVGDAFLLKAFAFLHTLEKSIPTKKFDAIWNVIISQFFELGDAEALEISLKGNIKISPEKCLQVMEKKASTFEAHMRIGAIIGGGRRKEIDTLGYFGKTLGALINIREDYIDIFEPDELLNRINNELPPLPLLFAFENSVVKRTIMDVISKPKISGTDIERLVDIVLDEKVLKSLKSRIRDLVIEASETIVGLQNREIKSQLQTLVKSILEDL